MQDVVAQLKQLRPNLSFSLDEKVAALNASTIGMSAAQTLVLIDDACSRLSRDLLRITQENDEARTFIAQRDADIAARERARDDNENFQATTTWVLKLFCRMLLSS